MFGGFPPPQNEETPLRGRSPYACFPGDTKIVTKSQHRRIPSKRIDQIVIGDEVLSYNESSGRKELDTVTAVLSHETSELYSLELSNGNKVVCSPEHPFYVPQLGWVRADALCVGNKLIQYKYVGLSLRISGLADKGKSYTERYGNKASSVLHNLSVANTGRRSNRIGKTYVELFGAERAAQIAILKKSKPSPLKGRIRPVISAAKKGKPAWNKGIPSNVIPWNKGLTSKNNAKVAALCKKSGLSIKRLWTDIEFIQKQLKARHTCPNKHEVILQSIINEICPNEFGYNGGCELGIILNRKVPDFVNINGKRKVIEYFGEYWHTKPYKDSDSSLIAKYKECGFDCLVVWEPELKDTNTLKTKIQTFVYNPNVEIVSVSKITKEKTYAKVFNIETKTNHNYFANGILVHNCAKIYAHNMIRNYRESYGLFCCSGICFNHESQRRPVAFVTRKITNAVARIKLGKQSKLEFGNLEGSRDWGYAPDYVKGMLMMLERDKPDDFVLGTGIGHTVRDFAKAAFECVGLNYERYVEINPRYVRPSETYPLLANPAKANTVLGWKAETTFEQLVKKMVDYDLKLEGGK